LEKKYAAFLAQYEVELSHKSDHEIRHETDKKLLEQIKKGEVEQGNVQTAQDFEDLCAKELEEFKAASRVTEADKTNDIKSLDRALQSHLLLAVQQKVGKEYKWSVPHMKLSGQESLRQVAEDALILFCPDVKARVIGNAPWGVYKYNYPTKIRDESGAFGSKVFFYKAQLLSGQMTMPKDKAVASTIKDFVWLTRAELPEYFFKDYFHSLSDLLIPEY
jgi:large subunit ribosomal protein L46